jgi:hypothetical protein
MKKIIGVDVDEVLRAYIETFHHFYEKEFNLKVYDKHGEQIAGYNCDFHTNNLSELFEFKEGYRKTTYMVSDLDVVYSSKQKFEDEEVFVSKEDALNIFKYEDYLMELYGTCPKTYTNVGLDLAKLNDKYKDVAEFRIIVKDKTITVGPTLFFLSTLRPTIKNYHFVNTIDDVWNLCDVYITANPDFIYTVPSKKEIILKDMPYNKYIQSEYRVNRLSELLENNFINKILENE